MAHAASCNDPTAKLRRRLRIGRWALLLGTASLQRALAAGVSCGSFFPVGPLSAIGVRRTDTSALGPVHVLR
jgi:hypothetical protein